MTEAPKGGSGQADHSSDMEQLVVLRHELSMQQAQMLKSNLEGLGIPAFLSDDDAASMRFGVQTDLLVRAKHWKSAEGVLTKISLMPNTAVPQTDDIACTQCGSSRIHPFVGEVPTFVPKVKVSAEPDGSWYHCLECDSYWRDRRSRFASFPVALMWSITLGLLMLAVYSFIQWLKWL